MSFIACIILQMQTHSNETITTETAALSQKITCDF